MNRLISNTQFGKWLSETKEFFDAYENGDFSSYEAYKYKVRENYDAFLSKSNQLGFFIPCDLYGNVLTEPEMYMTIQNIGAMNSGASENDCILVEQFHAAKSRILFEGWSAEFDEEQSNRISFINNDNNDFSYCVALGELPETVEGILFECYGENSLTLTETAKNQILKN